MTEFEKKAEGIFARFTQKLAKVDLRAAIAIPAAVGVATVLVGVGMEVHGQSALLQHGGVAALDAYRDAMSAMQLPVREWFQQGLAGKLTSFGDNTQARGFVITAAAPVFSAAAVTLARGFTKLKQALVARGESLREDAHAAAHSAEQPDDAGRYGWAEARATEVTEGSWREPARIVTTIPDRVGTVEMLRRVALAHRVKLDDLVIENGEVRQYNNASLSSRPLCKIGSPFWTETERDTLVLHRLARQHQLDAAALYIREGVVYEQNDEAFVDRTVCKIGSMTWDAAQREQLSHELDALFGVEQPAQALSADADSTALPDSAPRARFRPA